MGRVSNDVSQHAFFRLCRIKSAFSTNRFVAGQETFNSNVKSCSFIVSFTSVSLLSSTNSCLDDRRRAGSHQEDCYREPIERQVHLEKYLISAA